MEEEAFGTNCLAKIDGFQREERTIIFVSPALPTVSALQTIMSDDFEKADRYQGFRLLFSNLGPQALQYRVLFTRTTNLWVDKITAQRILPEEGEKHDSDERVLRG